MAAPAGARAWGTHVGLAARWPRYRSWRGPSTAATRRLCLLFVAFLAPAAGAQTPVWAPLPGSPFHGYRFEDASFVSPDHGWIINGSGETWETTDGGASWTRRSDLTDYHRSTVFVGPSHGWIGTLYGPRALYETTDGGVTLVDVSSRIVPALASGTGICGLFAIDPQTIVGVGQWNGPAYLIRTTDGGATWTSRSVAGLAGSLIDVYFHDAQHGIAVGGTAATDAGSRAVVLGTDDGGATWTRRFVSSGTGTSAEWGWKISFPTPQVGYVSVEYVGSTSTGKVLKTTDGGATWTELSVPGGQSMQGVGFLDANVGWTSGRGTVMRTTNGGATWTPSAELDGSVNRFEFFGDTLGYAMGQHVFRLVAPVVDTVPPPADAFALTVGPSPALGGLVTVRATVPAGDARVDVLDALGRRVAVLADGPVGAGALAATWDASAVAPGVYAVRLAAGGRVVTRSVVVAPR